MTNETPSPETIELKPIPFGARLKAAREALGLDRKEVAMQLRLSEKIIIMMEKERYAADLPATFIRGYVRAYGKFLQLPDHEINKAIEPIKPKQLINNIIPFSSRSLVPVTSKHYFMQIGTYLIAFTMVGLLAMWWYTRANPSSSLLESAESMIEGLASKKALASVEKPLPTSEVSTTPSSQTTINLNQATNHLVASNATNNRELNTNDPYLDDVDNN